MTVHTKSFEQVCGICESLISLDLEIQKKAIIGYTNEISIYMRAIGETLDMQKLRGSFPVPIWYKSEEEAIFHELWGYAGMAQWWHTLYLLSPSAKIIGDEIFFLVDGRMQKMPQQINIHRREQLVRAFLLFSPEERLDRDFHEIYLLDGCRVTVFKGALAKKGRDTIIFRRYIVPEYTLEEQAARGTIPQAAVPMLTAMAHTGYNVVFCGSVRSAKTTFLSTWQRMEDPMLEGVMVETDPEIPLHRLIPGAPIVQLVCNEERLKVIAKNLLRSDADYFIIAEARDGIALDTAVRVARKGTGRMKMTFHTRNPFDFPEDAAIEIVRAVGGDIRETAIRVAGSFDYLFHFVSIRKENVKKLRGIYEVGKADTETEGITHEERVRGWYVREICRYDFAVDDWIFINRISGEKRIRGIESDATAFFAFEQELKKLTLNGGGHD